MPFPFDNAGLHHQRPRPCAVGTLARWGLLATGAALAACTSGAGPGTAPAAARAPMACDDTLKSAFRPDALTRVLAVHAYRQGDKVFVSDSATPVTLAADLCLVKLVVGPGNPGPADARSTSAGIGIEVWLPKATAWNERIRNYGGGGHVGGNHGDAAALGVAAASAVGSKFPAPVIAGMGYASGTTDAGQRWSQNGSYQFLPDGTLNFSLLKDFASRSLAEQALKTRALVELFYGRAPRFSYFDGHSTGGRQGWKVAQEWPHLYDGYLIAAPAISTGKFSLGALYPQLVMKADLGFTAADPAFAASNFKAKVEAVNRRAVQVCDKEQLGFLLDPSACNHDPAKDAAALCTGVLGQGGVVGSNADPRTCVNLKEALVINKLWYGATRDGSYDANQTAAARNGTTLGSQQLWWPLPRGANWGAMVGSVGGTERLALFMQDVRYAASVGVNAGVDIVNRATPERDKWRELDYAALVAAYDKGQALDEALGGANTDSADLAKLRQSGRKVITYTGLAEDVIPPATSVHHYERVVAAAGGLAQAQQSVRLYLVPGKAHSSQGRAWVVASATDPSRNNSVPLPALPGAANQTPSREQDQLFSALVDWVERAQAPGDITITSRDKSVSYPLCVYPKKAQWNGVGSSREASSYACK
jgi:Tannase and feruloyl esterase